MLKHTVTYTNFNDQAVTKDLYFNLTVSEIVKLDARDDGSSLEEAIKKIMDSKNNLALVDEFEKIILGAYGEKSDDGEHFVKNDEIREKFKSSLAYDALFTELIVNENTVADFIIGIMPKDLANKLKSQAGRNQDKPTQIPAAFQMPTPPKAPTS